MSKQHLLVHIIEQLKQTESQDLKYLLLEKYKNEKMLERIMSISYNPWIDLKMQDFDTPKSGKKFGMGISKFLHIIDDIIDGKLDEKEKRFSCNMALNHINELEADLFKNLLRQDLDLDLSAHTINRVWPGLIMSFPMRYASPGTIVDYKNFPACVQPISKGLRINIIVYDNKVSYRGEAGNYMPESWTVWDTQFKNLVQGQNTVLDGHAVVVDENNNIIETNDEKVLEAEPEDIRFVFWDVIRYDGFIRGIDDRMGYNWRYNGLNHMMLLAISKNPNPCYSALPAEMVGSQEQLDSTVKEYKNGCVVKQLDGIWNHNFTDQELIIS